MVEMLLITNTLVAYIVADDAIWQTCRHFLNLNIILYIYGARMQNASEKKTLYFIAENKYANVHSHHTYTFIWCMMTDD